MESTAYHALRAQLIERRRRLEGAIAGLGEAPQFVSLLQEVDSALERMNSGAYGLCKICHRAIDETQLRADPLLGVCIDCLDASQRSALEQDLDLASRIQRALLPQNDVVIHGWQMSYHYEPAGPVSGDYCDVVECPGGGLLFVVADVSGKGVAASMLMTHIHATFHSLNAFGLPINELVQRANRQLCESTLSTHYSTLVCGGVAESGEVEICNAGHCPPFLIRAAEVTSVRATGLPIGLFCGAEYGVSRAHLAPGDSIVIYTDGLSEARGGEEEYGEQRIVRLVSGHHELRPRQLIDAFVQDLTGFLSGSARADDLTIMVIQRAAGEASQ